MLINAAINFYLNRRRKRQNSKKAKLNRNTQVYFPITSGISNVALALVEPLQYTQYQYHSNLSRCDTSFLR